MAILTEGELKESREAIQAGVQNEPGEQITAAIASAQRSLNMLLGYKVETTDATVTVRAPNRASRLNLPQWVRSVTGVTQDGSATSIGNLHHDGFTLYDAGSFYGTVVVTGEFGFEEGSDEYETAKEWVLKAAVDELVQTKASSGRIPYGIESVSSEGVNLRFGPERRPDLKDLLEKLPTHPSKNRGGLFTITLTDATPELAHVDRVFLGLETPDDL